MISVVPIVVALFVVSQLLQQASRGRKRRSAPGQSEIVWVVLAWTAQPMIAILFLGLADEGRVWALLPFAALVVTLFPWPTARCVAIPLGLPRTSYYVTLLSGLTWRRDRSGGALLAATLAAMRRRRTGARVAAFLESRLTRCKPLRGAAVAALGFMALCRDDRVAARQLLASALEMDRRIVPAAARRMAKEWLAAEAAALGDWKRILSLALVAGNNSRTIRLLAAVAARLLRAPHAPSALGLWGYWTLAPRRRKTLALVRRAMAEGTAPVSAPIQAAIGKFVSPGGVQPALRLHALLLARGESISPADFCSLCAAWDTVLSDRAIEVAIAKRAQLMRARNADAVFGRFVREVEVSLTGLALAQELALCNVSSSSHTLQRVARSLRGRLLAEAEAASEMLKRRRAEGRALPAADEWRELLALRELYERACRRCGDSIRQVLFATMYAPLSNHGAWLFNQRAERAIANAMFSWLLKEAVAVGDAQAEQLQRSNIECGPF